MDDSLSPPNDLSTINEDTIRKIWLHYQLGPVRQITKLPSGVRNLSFLINDSLVIRFNTQDPGSPKFHNERTAYETLAKHSLPVPEVLVVDDSHRVTPYDFSITTRLPGDNLATTWGHLSSNQLHSLLYHIGQSLARIHDCAFPGFGKLVLLNYPSWRGYIDDYIERQRRQANDLGLLDQDLNDSVERCRQWALSDFSQVTSPALIHCDFHYENILHVNGQLSGILDFEWALAGDPSYDFMIAEVRERMVPNSEASLIAGYQSLRPFHSGHERHIFWYRLFLQLEEASMYQRAGDTQRAANSLQRLRRLIELTRQS